MRDNLNALAAQSDWVLPGLDEGRLLTGCDTPQDIARFYREAGATQVVVKLGPQGAYVDGPAGCAFVPAFPVAQVVDTVGAGDAFAVGVISALLEGASLEKAASRGAWLGARAVQVRGDCEGLPSRAELNAAGV
jgi:2-dehydro-3-deoxygluconokinase